MKRGYVEGPYVQIHHCIVRPASAVNEAHPQPSVDFRREILQFAREWLPRT